MKSDNIKKGIQRAPHRSLLRACGLKDEDFKKPFIGIANSFTEIVPGHIHLKNLVEFVKEGIIAAGGIPFEFNTMAVCDGISMNHDGMKYSLPSREIIAATVESMAKGHSLDGLVLIPSCDKVVPGMIMGASRVNIPTIVVTGGPMESGRYNGKNVDLISVLNYLQEKLQKKKWMNLKDVHVLEQVAVLDYLLQTQWHVFVKQWVYLSRYAQQLMHWIKKMKKWHIILDVVLLEWLKKI